MTLVLSFKREVAKALGKLTSMGYHEQDILNLATILEIRSIDAESFAIGLSKYSQLKKIVEQLTQQANTLKNEITLLEEQRSHLADNHVQMTDYQARNLLLACQAISCWVTMIQVAQKIEG